jgi:hypothetical protein
LGTLWRLIDGGVAVFDSLSALADDFNFTMRFHLDSVSYVAWNMYSLDCTGSAQGLPSEHGPFGYLTGYYFFRDNQCIGPLLQSVRNISHLPPIHVLATGLNHSQVLTEFQSADRYYVEASA